MLRLPEELVREICQRLGPLDIGASRATSKELKNNTASSFVKTFDTVEIHLDEPHLDYLNWLSKSTFAGFVRVVHVRPRYKIVPINVWEREGNRQPTDAELYIARGDDVRELARALGSFRNLVCVEVEASPSSALPSSLAEGEDQNSRAVVKVGGIKLTGITYAFTAVLRALAMLQGNGIAVRELRAGTMPNGVVRKSTDHLSLQLNLYPQSLSQILGQLQTLDLVLEVRPGTRGTDCAALLAQFLAQTNNLRHVKLSFWHIAGDWLSETFKNVTLPHLQALKLQAAHDVNFNLLAEFLARHKSTLRTLELKNIIFIDDELAEAFPALFLSEGFLLRDINLRQLCSRGSGMLLFGTTLDYICNACEQDSRATCCNTTGLGCEHSSLVATKGEVSANEQLKQMKMMCTLPWPMRVVQPT
ncbi:hypothetical protein CERZMDRAFT_96362 [Cercospora zeae-maydis SCOH1-5]|uniref:F-box domain-containing protein n=1 Tax=Cercospora zeae-maydis SCOH1-5 TaxID=717836 RepID=A0A6A6FJ84_9PEZI|nr:hypothetical protein CERZMDRAFT_96362 [Cercospora zeae-maydis SCOH1-5]